MDTFEQNVCFDKIPLLDKIQVNLLDFFTIVQFYTIVKMKRNVII